MAKKLQLSSNFPKHLPALAEFCWVRASEVPRLVTTAGGLRAQGEAPWIRVRDFLMTPQEYSGMPQGRREEGKFVCQAAILGRYEWKYPNCFPSGVVLASQHAEPGLSGN